jgi:hypothetical protein
MADVTEAAHDPLDRRVVALGLVAAIVAFVLVRAALVGWAPTAPDDARYLFVGLSMLGGDGPVTPSGDIFWLRSPVYPLILAGGSGLVGGDPLDGAHLVATFFAIVCLVGAVRIGWLLGGAGAAIGTAVALAAMPILWRLTPTLRIDLPQTAGVVAVLLVVWRPTTRRWALGGVLFGLTVLVKESVLPMALLPMALLGAEPLRRVATLAMAFLAAAFVTAAWWWVLVWFGTGQVFPLNALDVITAREVERGLGLGRTTLVFGGVAIVGWAAMLVRARVDVGARLVIVAALCLLPAAAYAAKNGLDGRNYAGLAALSSVAIGVAAAMAARWVSSRIGGGRLLRAGVLAVVALSVAGVVVAGQRAAGPVPPAGVADALATWLRANTTPGDRIAMTFRDREAIALQLFDSVEVANLFPTRVQAEDDPGTFLWMGLRDQQLFGYRRADWDRALTDPAVRYVVMSGPHPFHPTELLSAMADRPIPGLERVASIDGEGGQAEVFAVDPTILALGPESAPTAMSAEAALAWLDLAEPTGKVIADGRLLAAGPIVSGDAVPELLARLGMCPASTDSSGSVYLSPEERCPV